MKALISTLNPILNNPLQEIYVDSLDLITKYTKKDDKNKSKKKEEMLRATNIELVLNEDETCFGFSYTCSNNSFHPLVTKIIPNGASCRANLQLSVNIILINGKPTYKRSPKSIAQLILRGLKKRKLKISVTHKDIISWDGFHLAYCDNFPENKKENILLTDSNNHLKKQSITDSFRTYFSLTRNKSKTSVEMKSIDKKKIKANVRQEKEMIKDDISELNGLLGNFNYNFHDFLSEMIELGRYTTDIQDKSKYEGMVSIITSANIKDVFEISVNLSKFLKSIMHEDLSCHKRLLDQTKFMNDISNQLKQSDAKTNLLKYITSPIIESLLSSYQGVLLCTVGQSRPIFRTDSQQKHESCLSNSSMPITVVKKSASFRENKDHLKSSKRSLKSSEISPNAVINNPTVMNGNNFETIQMVTLELNSCEDIGMTVINDHQNSIIIARLIKDQPADKSGLFQIHDEIFEVNNEPVKGLDVESVVLLINEQKKTGSISFLISHNSKAKKILNTAEMCMDKPDIGIQSPWVRSQFDYLCREDPFIPCTAIGLDICVGDVLEIVNKDDHHYWQAKKAIKSGGNLNTCEFEKKVGLIPSKIFQTQCEAVKAAFIENENEGDECVSGFCGCKILSNISTTDSDSVVDNDDMDPTQLTYQEMKICLPDPFNRRPIVIIGSRKNGMKDVVDKLIKEYAFTFEAPIIHTSSQKVLATSNKYFYMDFKSFEKAISLDKLVHYEFSNNIHYGVLTDSVSKVCKSGKICLFTTSTMTLKLLVKSILKPFIILLFSNENASLNDSSGSESSSNKNRNRKNKIEKIREHNRRLYKYVRPFVDASLSHEDTETSVKFILNIASNLMDKSNWVIA